MRNDLSGFSHIIAYTPLAVGATLAAFQGTPAQQRRIRRLDDRHINMDFIHADSPVQMSPRGSSAIQAVFLAPISIDARARAEAALTCSHVPTNPSTDQIGCPASAIVYTRGGAHLFILYPLPARYVK